MLLITALSFCLLSSSQELIVTTTQEPHMDMAAFAYNNSRGSTLDYTNGDWCGTTNTPENQRRMQRMLDDGTWEKYRLGEAKGNQRGGDIVNITAHIVRYDDGTGGLPEEDFHAQVAELNENVAATGLTFCVKDFLYHDDSSIAVVTYPNAPTVGMVANTMNVYCVPVLIGAGGFASYPPGLTFCIESTYMGPAWLVNSVFSHETGHYFNLPHTFNGGDECVDGSNCSTAGDFICDTPADDNGGFSGFTTCIYTGTALDQCGSGMPYDPIPTNIMSYMCLKTFTAEQLNVFLATANNERSNHLSMICEEPPATGACCIDVKCIQLSEDDCVSIDGTYFGDGNACASTSCIPEVYIDYPDGKPSLLDPYGTSVAINFLSGTTEPAEDSGNLHLSIHGGDWEEIPLVAATESDYVAVFPYLECEETIAWYISVDTVDGDVVQSPYNAPENTWQSPVFSGSATEFYDDFQSNMGWQTYSKAETGNWLRVVPSGNGDFCEPATAVGGSGMCFVTGNNYHEDVDNGMTMLESPSITIDMDKAPALSYYRWYSNGTNCNGANANVEMMRVEYSLDGNTFTELEVVGPEGEDAEGGWRFAEFYLNDFLDDTGEIDLIIRFTVEDDMMYPSVVEAGVDNFKVTTAYCSACYLADINKDGGVGVTDLLMVIDQWGTDGIADINSDGTVDVSDLLAIVDAWGPCT